MYEDLKFRCFMSLPSATWLILVIKSLLKLIFFFLKEVKSQGSGLRPGSRPLQSVPRGLFREACVAQRLSGRQRQALRFNNSLKAEPRGALCCTGQAGSWGSTAAADTKTHPSDALCWGEPKEECFFPSERHTG